MSALTSSQTIEGMRLLCAMIYSSCALLVWDYLLTLDDEITYIWDSQSSFVKYLFIGNRYVYLFAQPFRISQVAGAFSLDSNASCLGFAWAMGLSQCWSYGSVHILVLLRVWILYGRTRKITVALAVAFILYLCAAIALLAYILAAIHFSLNARTGEMCGEEQPPFSWSVWIVEFLLEVFLFGLTIFMLKQQKSTSEFFRMSRLVRCLYRDAIIFLLANTLGDISNIIAWTLFVGTPFRDATTAFSVALVNITGQRLAIGLRRLHIQKDITESEISREVEYQLAAFDSDPGVL